MTPEEKAARYDEAIKVAKSNYETIVQMDNDCTFAKEGIINTFHHMFPELKESEDERIRKELIRAFNSLNTIKVWNGIERTDILAWLEKQSSNTYELGYTEGMRVKNKEWIEKQGEQKSDIVEPKFHEGDWIVFNGLTLLVKEVVKGYYKTISIGGIPNSYDWNIDNAARLWTIQDAKDSDVLTYNDSRNNVYVCIYKEYANERVYDYCTLDKESFWECSNWNYLASFSYTPATKEQRDQLQKAMADAGYTFDFEKKELKKIEQNPAWSEEDEMNLRRLMLYLSCREKIIPEVKSKYMDWFKSLKDRYTWKPSDEQMEALEHFIVYHNGSTNYAKDLEELRLQLKKLKE